MNEIHPDQPAEPAESLNLKMARGLSAAALLGGSFGAGGLAAGNYELGLCMLSATALCAGVAVMHLHQSVGERATPPDQG